MQTTIKSLVTFDGVGLHSGAPVRMKILPAMPNSGITFRRVDDVTGNRDLPALWHMVQQTPLCTRLVNDDGVTVSTVEHIMAAIVGCGVNNAVIEVDGPEIPILDGSSAAFVRGILSKGLREMRAPLQVYRITDTIEVRRGESWARFTPADRLLIDFSIEFEDAAIGAQKKTLDMSNGSFVRELSNSRTFCRQADVDMMRAQGLALGGTLENAVVVDGDQVLSPGGLRHKDEAVRHKMLDALGDLGMAGAPILGHYEGFRAGHSLTNELLRTMFANSACFEKVSCTAEMAAKLPGAGVHWGEIPEVA